LALAGCGPERYEVTIPEKYQPAPAASAPVAAEAGAPEATALNDLTRERVQRIALAGNRQFRIKQSALQRARLGQAIAYSDVYAPTLNATFTTTDSDVADPDNIGSATVNMPVPALGFTITPFLTSAYDEFGATGDDTYVTSYGVTVARKLLAISEHRRQRLPITSAEEAFYVAANNLVLEGKNLELQSTRLFFNIQRAQARLRVRQRRVEDARQFLTVVKDNVTHGFKAPVEELQASIDLNQAEASLLDEQTNVQNAKENLLKALALALTTPMTIAEEDVSTFTAPKFDIAQDVLLVLAREETLGNQTADINLQLENLLLRRDELFPDLTAAVTAERRKTGDAVFDDSVEDENRLSLTLTLQMPLDFQRKARSRYKQLKLEIDEKHLQLREAEQGLEQRLRSTHRLVEQLENTVRLSALKLSAEQGRMQVNLDRYAAGTIDNLEVSRAKQSLDQAEIDLLESRINLVTTAAEYRAILPSRIAETAEPADVKP
jgi:outer membrane protein TolC